MLHQTETQWMGKMQFNALVNGHTIIMDAPVKSGGEDLGSTPKPFLLTAMAGCTGMDIVVLLKKQNIALESLNLKVSGETGKQTPVVYVAANIVYEITGHTKDKQAAIDAVLYSQEKMCGVSHMLKKIMPVTWQIIYNGEQVYNNREETKQ